jgi:hypothetical protein
MSYEDISYEIELIAPQIQRLENQKSRDDQDEEMLVGLIARLNKMKDILRDRLRRGHDC